MTRATRPRERERKASSTEKASVEIFESFVARTRGDRRFNDPLEEAQDIMWDACDLDDRRRRVALARRALKVSPLCADAYVMLAVEDAATDDDALRLYRQGVEAGEKALGEAVFRERAGDFWGILETRPYMRARQGLAEALWSVGRRDEAVEHYQDMLRLNPNDNQGIRYLLVDRLLALGRDESAAELLERYDDDAAAWAWSEALLSFRRNGDTVPADRARTQAIAANTHVPAYLLGRKKMPRRLPAYIRMGGEDEAISYVASAREAWAAAPGALAWLEAAVKAASPESKKAPTVEIDPIAIWTDDIDTDRIDDAALALLLLGLHGHGRVWKSFDWDTMARLYEKGFISDPVGKAKSVVLTTEGAARSQRLFREFFARRQP